MKLTDREMAQNNAALARGLFATQAWKESAALLSYINLPGEAATAPIIEEALRHGKPVFAPRIAGEDLSFHRIRSSSDASELHPYGMKEPLADLPAFPAGIAEPAAVAAAPTAVILVPGLAFDRQKNRLGRGKGFYDRFLSQARFRFPNISFVFIGLCFDIQLVDSVPTSSRDVGVDLVVTEHAVIQ